MGAEPDPDPDSLETLDPDSINPDPDSMNPDPDNQIFYFFL